MAAGRGERGPAAISPSFDVDLTETNEGNEAPNGGDVIEWNVSGRAARLANPSPSVTFVGFCEICSGFRDKRGQNLPTQHG
jgi:hypothetical protein